MTPGGKRAVRDKTAALLVIGNEILSGKVVDTNSSFLARELHGLGVALRRILVIPDELSEIASAVSFARPKHDAVFTSGGVGPTHDDVTIAGVARGLDRSVVRHPLMERKLREFFGDSINEPHLKMAEIPEGGDLVFDGGLNFPTVVVDNIYILPGIPELFRAKFLALKDRFAVDPYYLRIVYTGEMESTIAVALNETLAAFPELLLGSYPKLEADYQVRITLESKDPNYLERAFQHLLQVMPAGAVLRTE